MPRLRFLPVSLLPLGMLLLALPAQAVEAPPLPNRAVEAPPMPAGAPPVAAPATRPVAPAAIPAPAAPALRPGEMMFNFQDADIQAVIKTVSQFTGRNFLIDPRVKGKITIVSSKPLARAAVYEVFLSAIRSQGFNAVDGPGGIIKIVPDVEARQGARLEDGQRFSDQWVTQVVPVERASANQLVPLLRPLLSTNATLSVYPPSNLLIVTDTSSAIRSMLRVLARIDQKGAADITVIPLKHVSALDVAQIVSRLLEGASAAVISPALAPGQPPAAAGAATVDQRLTIVPDLRTNSLMVRADNPTRVHELRTLIDKIDVPARGTGQTHVVFLRNAESKKLAETLRGLLAAEARSAAPAAAPGAPGAARSGETTSLIQADEATNSLVISAPDAVYNNLRAVIEKLDQRRAQVYVEALITEVSSTRASELGIQWSTGAAVGKGGIAGVFNVPSGPGIIETVATQGATLVDAGGLTVGFIGNEVTLSDGRKVRGLGALARALETDVDANILSTPNLLTVDNVEAKIIVGQNVPFLTGSFAQATGTGTTVNPFQTIERKDVGLTLKIKPQISEGNGIRLQIFQEIQSVVPSKDPLIQSTNKRSIETTVVVDDGNMIVLGGLIEDRSSRGITGIPYLSSIPFIGPLFTYRDRSKAKTNLMVFLRPLIVRSTEDSSGFTVNRYDYMRGVNPDLARDQKAILERFAPGSVKPRQEKDAGKTEVTPKTEGPAQAETAPETPAAKPAADDTPVPAAAQPAPPAAATPPVTAPAAIPVPAPEPAAPVPEQTAPAAEPTAAPTPPPATAPGEPAP